MTATRRLMKAKPSPAAKPVPSGFLQRKCACGSHSLAGGECENCKPNRLGLHRKAVGQSDPSAVPPIVHDVLHSPGQRLDAATRALMEPRFGHDFSHIRVHADGRAAESARAINARAYTVGRDIVFGAGEYGPLESEGRGLLAHEIAHTIQQARVSTSAPQSVLEIGAADDPLEHEADRVAAQVMSAPSESRGGVGSPGRAPGPVLSMSRPMLQRQEQPRKPLIPIPVFDELDPMVIVPDVPGVPSFLRGRQVKLSTLRSALDVLRGNLPHLGPPGQDFCQTLLPGYETAHGGDVDGLCCPQFVRERARCCRPRDIGLMSYRCCTADEVIIDNRCVRPERAPLTTPGATLPTLPTFPTLPPLQLQMPEIRFGTIESDTVDHFALNGAAIPASGTAKLDLLASQLKLYRDAEVHVEGHTDSSYTEQYNQRLSERRAQTVRDALVRRGIEPRRITAQGFGETRLLFPSESNAEEKAKNRRVDVWFYIPPSRGIGEEFRLQPSIAP
jgi:hypothetical protein